MQHSQINKHQVQKKSGFKKTGSQAAFFQPKLIINQIDDNYEQEADAVAEKVMRMPDTKTESLFFQPKPLPLTHIQRECAACESDEKLYRKEVGEEEEENVQMKGETGAAGGMTAPSVVHDAISSPGQPLDKGTRNFMESRFGYDLGDVRVHNDSLAHRSSADINALAYTHGNHVVFSTGQYRPYANSGRHLLAHELAHVLQQSGGLQRFIQRRTDAFGKECPDKVEIGGKKTIPAFNKEMFDKGYRTYFGLVTSMKVGPKDDYEACITEVLKVEENTCGNEGNLADYNPCSPKKHCLRVNKACGDPTGPAPCGDNLTNTLFPASPTTFVDLHRSARDTSMLDGSGKTACKVKCLQRYGCGGKEIGRFYITRNFKSSLYKEGAKKIPITIGTIDKEIAKK